MNSAHAALRQVIEGRDFDPPATLLSNISAANAVRVLPGAPYSIATNIAHADIWQCVWLCQLEGKPKFNPFPDFPIVAKEDWPTVRAAFLENLQRAYAIAAEVSDDDEKLTAKLLKFAVHGSYHLGQVKLLKRMLRAKT